MGSEPDVASRREAPRRDVMLAGAIGFVVPNTHPRGHSRGRKHPLAGGLDWHYHAPEVNDVSEELSARVREAFEAGKGKTKNGIAYLPLATLESETVIGLDAELRWLAVPPDDRAPFIYGPGTEHVLSEVIEWKRANLETALESGAAALGLPADDVLFSFPTVGIVRGILGKQSGYLIRLALQWLRTTELRELRADIVRVAEDKCLPRPVKDLASRLIVPE